MRGIILSALVVAVAAAAPHPASAADEQRHFDRPATEMSTCVAMEAHAASPDLEFDLSVSPPQTVAAKKYRSDQDNIWSAEFNDASGGTDVVLRKGTGSTSDLDAAWQIVERCG